MQITYLEGRGHKKALAGRAIDSGMVSYYD